MSSDLLRYYNEELRFLRQQGQEFALRHPQVASRLALDDESSENVRDPHVERLIQGVAFLNARTRLKLDDDFPEITEALLDLIAPHYTAPVPAMSIVECRLGEAQAGLVQGMHLARETPVESAALPDGEPLRFRTVYQLSVWPIAVADAQLEHRPFAAPDVPSARTAAAAIRLRLKTLSNEISLREIETTTLRLFLNGQPPYIYDLYELLMTSVTGVTLGVPGAARARELDPGSTVFPVGFGINETALPSSPRTLPGYTLLSEFFVFPQKFLFVDLKFPAAIWRELGSEAEILLYLNREATPLVPSITASTFRLGCTPVVNLYTQTAEPIRVSHMAPDYRVIPDSRRPRVHEVYSIDRVTSVAAGGRLREFFPFYSFHRGEDRNDNACYWLATRRLPAGARENEEGSDVSLSLVDLDFQPGAPGDVTLKVETTCVTRDGQRLRYFDDGLPRLAPRQNDAALLRMQCITRITPVLRPVVGRGTRWRLLSHLATNGLALRDFEAGADGLRELLKLYNLREDKRATEMIAGLASVRFDRATGRVQELVGGRRQEFICRGHHVTLEFDETRYTAGGLYLFASVLDRFLGSYCSINSFVQTSAVTRQRGAFAEWARRAGDQILL
jgi:type VI secretion system protein ImpG